MLVIVGCNYLLLILSNNYLLNDLLRNKSTFLPYIILQHTTISFFTRNFIIIIFYLLKIVRISILTACQALSEIQTPIDKELGGVIAGKKGIICESVLSEFKELVSMCGGPNEKLRADELLKCLM